MGGGVLFCNSLLYSHTECNEMVKIVTNENSIKGATDKELSAREGLVRNCYHLESNIATGKEFTSRCVDSKANNL